MPGPASTACIIKPRVDKTFPLDQAREAHRYMQERKNKGKVVLEIE